MSWGIRSLSELTILMKRGIAPKYVEQGGVYILNQKCIRSGVVSYDYSRLCSNDKKINDEKLLQQGDILVNSTGAGTLGRTGYVKEVQNTTTIDTHVTIVRADENIIDKKFLSLQLSLKEPEIVSMGKGATNQTELSATDLGKLEITLPPLQTQKRIASILSAYDDLIENNLKRIKLLEETAQNIYKEWFVNFRFPNYENTPINQETGLPEGWEKVIFSDLYSLNNGCAFKSEDYKNDGVPILRTRDYSNSFFINMNDPIYISNDLLPTFSKYLVEELDFLIIMVGASIGKYGVVLKKDLPSLLNQNQWAIRTLNDFSEYSSYKLFSLKDVMRELLMKRTGAARDFFRASFLKEIKVIKPDREIILEFNKEIKPIMNLISSMLSQNQKLKEARDILLPRLMNRTIEV